MRQDTKSSSGSCFSGFQPDVVAWFTERFAAPTPPQVEAWPAIKAGGHVLISAPTGSGKTLSAFLASIDDLARMGREGELEQRTCVLYVSPLKALSTDIRKNLTEPLAEIAERMADGGAAVTIDIAARTGDTPQSERQRMRKKNPHILVTTPESLYILLTSASGRDMLKHVRSVIVDEIHAVAGSKRGSHLALSLARLDALALSPPQRIGLSATQKPIESMARFLCGDEPCTIIDTGHHRERDLALEVPQSPLSAVMANEVWEEIYVRLEHLIQTHSTTLIFVNTRRLAERAARHLADRLGSDAVTAHHGSLAKEHRLDAETRLKEGRLKALISTASLELGIDIGDVDLVCQLGSPRAISAFLQRVGRSGHAVGGLPKGRLFPLTRDDLVECTALMTAVRNDELDQIIIPDAPRDVLAQQIIAEVSAQDWEEKALYQALTRAWPYRDLPFDTFVSVTRMLAEGFATRRGRRSAYLYRDGVNGRLKARKSARLTALSNGGAIPDQFDYEVVLRPQDLRIGTLNEDFAFESLPGDVFQLGNTSYQILKVESGKVFVQDAKGMAPTIPFWFGEAPGRTDELSFAVSRLRQGLDERMARGSAHIAQRWLEDELDIPTAAAEQLVDHLGKAHAALGGLPHHGRIVLERFFDETGDMHLVIHSTFGSRVNRAFGLALRKRFCRKFNFELQAAALEDSLVLSLGPTHSFPLEEVVGYLNAGTAEEVLIQALLDAPMFNARWRWVATTAMAVRRMMNGARRPAQFQRNDAEDLVAVCFPDQLACLENVAGAREVPDHPLVQQAIDDCLHEVMDVEGLKSLLAGIASGNIEVVCRDLTHPSPLSREILNARPYAFLDDGAAEERRTLAVAARQDLSWEEAGSLGNLSPDVIATVVADAWPTLDGADALHDALLQAGFLTEPEIGNNDSLRILINDGRAAAIDGDMRRWFAAERMDEAIRAYPTDGKTDPDHQAVAELMRGRLTICGPINETRLQSVIGSDSVTFASAILMLEQEGSAVRGHFSDPDALQWCDRTLLARMHRQTLGRRRKSFRCVDPAAYLRFALRWHGLIEPAGEGKSALESTLIRLEGWSAPIGVWEKDILPRRLAAYRAADLEDLCASGRFAWLRVQSPRSERFEGKNLVATPIALMRRSELMHWCSPPHAPDLSSTAAALLKVLESGGAQFADELQRPLNLLDEQFEQALAELVGVGLVHSDNVLGLRYLTSTAKVRTARARYQRRGISVMSIADGGRWSLVSRPGAGTPERWERAEAVAKALIRRYGVVFRAVVEREQGLPPWRDLLYVLRRMEARDEVRGGRFVDGFAGEQFAAIEAVAALRRAVDEEQGNVILSTYDPLNLVGILTPDAKIPAHWGTSIRFVNGVPDADVVEESMSPVTLS